MHLIGSDLNFHWPAVSSDHRRVKTLVQVELRHCDVVLEAPHHGTPIPVNATESCVTVFNRRSNHPYRNDVEDVIKVSTLHHHLLVDTPQVLAAASDLTLDTCLNEPGTHRGDRLCDGHITFRSALRHKVIKFGEAFGM